MNYHSFWTDYSDRRRNTEDPQTAIRSTIIRWAMLQAGRNKIWPSCCLRGSLLRAEPGTQDCDKDHRVARRLGQRSPSAPTSLAFSFAKPRTKAL